jgi:hypothetical protein
MRQYLIERETPTLKPVSLRQYLRVGVGSHDWVPDTLATRWTDYNTCQEYRNANAPDDYIVYEGE